MIKLIKMLIKEQAKKNQRKKIRQKEAKNMPYNQIYQNLMKEIREREKVLFKRTKTPTKGDEDDLVHTDNDQDTNNEEPEEKYQRE